MYLQCTESPKNRILNQMLGDWPTQVTLGHYELLWTTLSYFGKLWAIFQYLRPKIWPQHSPQDSINSFSVERPVCTMRAKQMECTVRTELLAKAVSSFKGCERDCKRFPDNLSCFRARTATTSELISQNGSLNENLLSKLINILFCA